MTEVPSESTNLLLKSLPVTQYRKLASHLKPVSFRVGTVVYQSLSAIHTVYFPESAVFSLVSTLDDGATTEIALIGHTGMVGLPVILGSGRTKEQVIVQAQGSALQLPATILKQEFQQGKELHRLLLSYAEARLNQIHQRAVCNAQHTIPQRLARWLLSVQDLLHSNELPLTQESIARMLGVRRAGVTIALGIFQQAGLVHCQRGKITILNQKALKSNSCECYNLIQSEFSRLLRDQ